MSPQGNPNLLKNIADEYNTQLESLNLRQRKFLLFSHSCASKTNFYGHAQWWKLTDLEYLISKCPNITYLNLSENSSIPIRATFYDFLMQNCLRLKTLILSNVDYYPLKIKAMKEHFEGIKIDLQY